MFIIKYTNNALPRNFTDFPIFMANCLKLSTLTFLLNKLFWSNSTHVIIYNYCLFQKHAYTPISRKIKTDQKVDSCKIWTRNIMLDRIAATDSTCNLKNIYTNGYTCCDSTDVGVRALLFGKMGWNNGSHPKWRQEIKIIDSQLGHILARTKD